MRRLTSLSRVLAFTACVLWFRHMPVVRAQVDHTCIKEYATEGPTGSPCADCCPKTPVVDGIIITMADTSPGLQSQIVQSADCGSPDCPHVTCGSVSFEQVVNGDPACCLPSGTTPCNGGTCCSGLICLSTNVCGACIPNGRHANSPDDCCSYETDNSGTCVQCVPNGNFCVYDSDCCGNLCENFTCVSCVGGGQPCSQNSDCCGQWCSDGYCGIGDYCDPSGGSCIGDSDCCSDYCSLGICE